MGNFRKMWSPSIVFMSILVYSLAMACATQSTALFNTSQDDNLYFLNASKTLRKTSKSFLSFSIDSAEIRKDLPKPSLSNPKLIRMFSYLSPGYLRIGGTEADRLVYKSENAIPGLPTMLNPNNTFFMSDRQWMEICMFASCTGFKILFDLNVLMRKGHFWDFTNAKSLLDFSAVKCPNVDWQLGNEPNSFRHTFNVTLSPSQLSKDFAVLRKLLDSYPEFQGVKLVGPDVTAPHPHLDSLGISTPLPVTVLAEKFLQKFARSGGSKSVNALTWHHYYLRFNATVADFLSPAVFDSLQNEIDTMKRAINGSGKPLWITESGSASGGGIAGVSDRFVSSFLFLDCLGVSAREGIDIVVRQSLYSGHYALLNRKPLRPNPDWWVSCIYKRLVQPTVLLIKPIGEHSETLRIYAHCSHNGTVVVFGINLSEFSVHFKIETDRHSLTAELYQLTAPTLLSRDVMLNGKLLTLPPDSPPLFAPVTVKPQSPFMLASHSLFFLHYSDMYSDKC